MIKRIITIILILLAFFFVILGGLWLVGRHQATKVGATPLTFREFLGLGTSKKDISIINTPSSSVFTQTGNPGTTTGTGNANSGTSSVGTDTTNGGSNVQVSQFTGDTLSPSDNTTFNTNGSIGSGSGLGTDNLAGAGNGIGSVSTTNNTGLGGSSSTAITAGGLGSSCTAADITLTFTPTEIQQLNALQTQFNAIASNLATNDQLATELANYDSYKLEEAKIAEFQNFCQATLPLLTDPAMQRHVPTPFWHDATQDSDTFTGTGTANATANGNDPTSGESFLERILRINLW